MSADLVRRIATRRRVIASLRSAAERHEGEARALREQADSMERETDALEAKL